MYHFLDKNIAKKIPGTNEYREEQEKRLRKNDVSRLNRKMQEIIQKLPQLRESKEYEVSVRKANQFVIQSHILSLSYANNFENKKVLYAAIVFSLEVFLMVKEHKEKRFLLKEIERVSSQYERMFGLQREFNDLLRKNFKSTN